MKINKFSNNMRRESVANRTVLYVVSQIILQGITALSLPIFTRLLTTEQNGITSVYATWVSILAILISLQMNSVFLVAKVRYSSKEDFRKYEANACLLSVMVLLFSVVLVLIFPKTLNRFFELPTMYIVIMLLNAYGMGCAHAQSSIYVMDKRPIPDILLSIALSVSMCLLSIVLIKTMQGCEAYARIWGLSIPYMVVAGIYTLFNLKNIKRCVNKEMLCYSLKLSLPLIFSGISVMILNQSDRVMISKMVDNSKAGIYSVCYSVATPVLALKTAFGRSWISDYYEKLKAGNKETQIKSDARRYLFIFTCLTCGYMLVSPEALKILASSDYYAGIPIISVVVLGCYFMFLFSFPQDYELYCQKTKMIGFTSTVAALLNVLLNVCFIPRYEIMGAAVATAISYFSLFLIHDIVARSLKGYPFSRGFFLGGMIPVILIEAIVIAFLDNMFIRWSIGLIIGIVLLIALKRKKEIES